MIKKGESVPKQPIKVVRASVIPKRRNGFYDIEFKGEKIKLPAVTTILGKSIPKPQLTYWAQRETAKAIYLDPSISLEVAMAAPYRATQNATDRGRRIHSLAEAYFKTGQLMKKEDV